MTDTAALMNADEAAEYLGVSRRHFYNMQAAGELAVVRIGRRTLYLRADLDDFILRHREPATTGGVES